MASRLSQLLIASFVGTVSTFALAEPIQKNTQEDDLLSIVRETLDTNPEVQIRLESFWASTHDERQAFGGYLPTVDLNASLGMGRRTFDTRDNYNRNLVEASLTQMLFDGYRVRNAVARTKHESQARYYELLDEAENKALEVSETFIDIQRYRELVTLAQNNVANHVRVQKHVSERANRGVSNGADLKQIDGRLSLARANLMTEIANLQTVTARFQRLVGRFPAGSFAAFDVPSDKIPANLNTVLTSVYTNNPALYAAFEEIQSSNAAYGEAKSSRYPKLELGLSSGLYKNNNSFDERTDPRPYGAEVILELRGSYNLYNGGSDRASERAANRRIGQAESMRDKVCVDLRQTASIAHSDVRNLQIKLESLAEHRDDSQGVLDAYRKQFDIGRRSLLDVLDSENEFFQSRRAYVGAQYDLEINQLRTLNSMGRLLETLSVESQKLPSLGEMTHAAYPSDSPYCSLSNENALDPSRYLQEAEVEEIINLSSETLFDVGSAELKTSAAADLMELAQQLLVRATLKSISVIGHTDNTGNDVLNQKLSLQRAIAVRDALITYGINHIVILVTGAGQFNPVALNSTEEGRAKNRRVEIKISYSAKTDPIL